MAEPVTVSRRVSAPDGKQPPSARELLALGALLFAPVLLGFALSLFGGTFGWVVGISLGCVAGLALLWSSTSWTTAEKCVATGVWPGGMTPAFLLLTTGAAVCEQTAGGAEVCSSATLPLSLGLPILVGSVAAPLTVAVILLRLSAARRERSTAKALAAL